jgi:hypothetical protein
MDRDVPEHQQLNHLKKKFVPPAFSRMGKQTEYSFAMLKQKSANLVRSSAPQLGNPYAHDAKTRAISMFFESREEQ